MVRPLTLLLDSLTSDNLYQTGWRKPFIWYSQVALNRVLARIPDLFAQNWQFQGFLGCPIYQGGPQYIQIIHTHVFTY